MSTIRLDVRGAEASFKLVALEHVSVVQLGRFDSHGVYKKKKEDEGRKEGIANVMSGEVAVSSWRLRQISLHQLE